MTTEKSKKHTKEPTGLETTIVSNNQKKNCHTIYYTEEEKYLKDFEENANKSGIKKLFKVSNYPFSKYMFIDSSRKLNFIALNLNGLQFKQKYKFRPGIIGISKIGEVVYDYGNYGPTHKKISHYSREDYKIASYFEEDVKEKVKHNKKIFYSNEKGLFLFANEGEDYFIINWPKNIFDLWLTCGTCNKEKVIQKKENIITDIINKITNNLKKYGFESYDIMKNENPVLKYFYEFKYKNIFNNKSNSRHNEINLKEDIANYQEEIEVRKLYYSKKTSLPSLFNKIFRGKK